jgi:hypothetical protein
MPGFFHLLRCVGRAVVKNGARALASLIPFGQVLFDVAQDAQQEHRKTNSEADQKIELAGLAVATPTQIREKRPSSKRREGYPIPPTKLFRLV